MKYAVEMGSVAMTYKLGSLRSGSGVQKSGCGGEHTDTRKTCRYHGPTSVSQTRDHK
jgi:hypothetical protein